MASCMPVDPAGSLHHLVSMRASADRGKVTRGDSNTPEGDATEPFVANFGPPTAGTLNHIAGQPGAIFAGWDINRSIRKKKAASGPNWLFLLHAAGESESLVCGDSRRLEMEGPEVRSSEPIRD